MQISVEYNQECSSIEWLDEGAKGARLGFKSTAKGGLGQKRGPGASLSASEGGGGASVTPQATATIDPLVAKQVSAELKLCLCLCRRNSFTIGHSRCYRREPMTKIRLKDVKRSIGVRWF